MIVTALLAVLAGVAASPAGAAAVAPGAVKASVSLSLPDAFSVDRQAVAVPRRVLHLSGVVRPYVAGQSLKIRTFLGTRLIETEHVGLKSSPGGRYGRFTIGVSSPGVGDVSIVVGHSRTPTMQSFIGRISFSALDENVDFGATGRFVQLIQQRLAALHLYIPQTGVYDQGTGLAVDAYHRLLGWGTYQTLDGRTVSGLLDGFGAFKVRYPSDGRHVEGDIGEQLLALIDGSRVESIYPISSGKPSTPTILGRFSVYEKVPGYLPDGMYYSNFFYSGYAIHGYDPAPDYPASHGCTRLPIVDAISVYNWVDVGTRVDTYL